MPNDKIKVEWECVETTQGEAERRLSKAFEILFEEVRKKENSPKRVNKNCTAN